MSDMAMHPDNVGQAAFDDAGGQHADGGFIVRRLGLCDYTESFERMRSFTLARDAGTPDEIWLLEHRPVFTQGQAGKPEHLLSPGDIPVVQSDRGGQVTYHGPGQLVAYVMVDLNRRGYGVRSLVSKLENAMIATLAGYGIAAHARREAPGVYVGARKIGSLGLRIRNGRSYHGLALNVSTELEPFTRINPCGYAGLEATRLCDLGGPRQVDEVAQALLPQLLAELATAESPSAGAATGAMGEIDDMTQNASG
jgi:lipoyl(octanoyl) transferase